MIEELFFVCGIAGSVLFIMQFACSCVGSSDGDGSEIGKFFWNAKQRLVGFLMIFGWIGLACFKQWNLGASFSLAIALVAGLLASLTVAALFKSAKKFENPGQVFRIEDALGQEAVVYQTIDGALLGKITISLYDLTHEIDAVALQPVKIESFTRVRVVGIADASTVIVESLEEN